MAGINDFFASTVDEAVADSSTDAFSSMSSFKQRAKWQRNRKSKSKNTNQMNQSKSSNDRFIPRRDDPFDAQQSYQRGHDSHSSHNAVDDEKSESAILCSNSNSKSKILSFQAAAPEAKDGYIGSLRTLYTASSGRATTKVQSRHICQTAKRVLDAPDLADDYYLNLLHWGRSNQLAIGLGSCLYLWDAASGSIDLLIDLGEDTSVCSVRWNHNAQYLAVGDSNQTVTLLDAKKRKTLRKLHGHSARIGALSWNHSVLSTGSADSTIRHNDVRQKHYNVATLQCHEQEVCGLEWDNAANGTHLASGSNDNKVCVWTLNGGSNPVCEFTESLSAVKALAWCPWNKSLLATGGGSADRKIRIYDVTAGNGGNLCKQIDAESQVSSLIWNPFEKELLSSHGFSKNQISLWKYPSMKKTHDLTGHTARILCTTLSPNGQIVCSAAADETLRFWDVFEEKKVTTSSYGGSASGSGSKNGRKSNSLNMRIR